MDEMASRPIARLYCISVFHVNLNLINVDNLLFVFVSNQVRSARSLNF